MTKKLSAKIFSTKAFSFLELSLVILIIGFLITIFLGGEEVAKDAKLRHARSLTQNSPVASIPGLILWLDTTSERSFSESETKDESTISKWLDINPESSSASYLSQTSSTSNDHPVYKESCINGLPCLYFNGTAGSKISATKSLGIGTKYMSIFFVFTGSENATSTYSSQLFISDKSATFTPPIVIGSAFRFTTSTTDGKFFYDVATGSTYGINCTQCSESMVLIPKQPYIYSVIDDYTTSIFHYLNGTVANTASTDNNGAFLKHIGFVEVGSASYQGNVGEIIIFNRALTAANRKSVEQYLSKKWDIKIN